MRHNIHFRPITRREVQGLWDGEIPTMSRELRKQLGKRDTPQKYMVLILSPIYCFDSSAYNSDNFQVKPNWFQGIPKVCGKYVWPATETYDSNMALRKSVFTDESLMHKLIENVYLHLYPNFHIVTVRNDIGNFICVPLILNNYSGQVVSLQAYLVYISNK